MPSSASLGGATKRTVVLHRKQGVPLGINLVNDPAINPIAGVVYTVQPAGLAACAGVKEGDVIASVEGNSTSSMTHQEVIQAIGACGATVTMTVVTGHFPNNLYAIEQPVPTPAQAHRSAPAPAIKTTACLRPR
jgi:C-terminal processing protease CtpA/Prc